MIAPPCRLKMAVEFADEDEPPAGVDDGVGEAEYGQPSGDVSPADAKRTVGVGARRRAPVQSEGRRGERGRERDAAGGRAASVRF